MVDKNFIISLIVLTYNRNDDLETLLESIVSQTINKELIEVVIVDNTPTSIAKPIIEKYNDFLCIKYIENKENLGVCKGRNVGIINASCDYLLFLDDDNVFQENSILQNIVDRDFPLFNNPELGVIRYANLLPIYENNLIKSFYYSLQEYNDQSHIDKLKNKYGDSLPNIFYDKNIYLNLSIFGGAGFLTKKEVFEKIGMFDTNMLAYGADDMEISLRILKGNYKILLNPGIVIKHVEVRKNRNYLIQSLNYTTNQLINIYKNYPFLLTVFYIANWISLGTIGFYKDIKSKDTKINYFQFLFYIRSGFFVFFKLLITGKLKGQRKVMSYKLWKYLRVGINKDNENILSKAGLL